MPQKLPPPWLRYRWIANRALLIAVPLASLVGFTAMYAAMPIPREWFLVPLFVIDEAVEKIRDGSITGYVYDPTTAALKQAGNWGGAVDAFTLFLVLMVRQFWRPLLVVLLIVAVISWARSLLGF